MRHLCFCWSVLIVTAAAGGRAQPAALQQRLAAGQAAYQKQDYEAAEGIFRSVLATTPQDFAANEFLGLVLSAKNDLRGATRYFRAAAESNPRSAAAHVNLGTNLAQLQEDAAAEAEFRKAIALDARDYQANNNLGQLLVRLGRAGDGLRYLEVAQQLRPGDYANSYDVAAAELATGKTNEAEARIRAMLVTTPTGELHGLLGAVYEKQGKYELALSELETAARLDPNESSLFDYAAEFLRHGTPEPAIQTLERGLRLFPRSWKLRVGLGLALKQHEEPGRAAEEFCSAIDLAPADSRAYGFLASVSPGPGDAMKAALVRFERYAQQEPRNPQALYYYAVSLWNDAGGDDPAGKAEGLLRRAAELQPDFARAHLQLGIIYSRQGRQDDAMREYKVAAEKEPSLALAHYRLGETLMRAGQSEKGRHELEIWKTLRAKQKQREQEERDRLLQFVYAPDGKADGKR